MHGFPFCNWCENINECLNKNNNELKYIEKFYMKGETLFHQGQLCTLVGFVKEGIVDLEKSTIDGKIQTLTRLQRGDTFGEILVFSDQNHYICDVVAQTNTTIIYITKEDLYRFFLKDEESFKNFAKSMANRVNHLTSRINILSCVTLRDKILTYLKQESLKQQSNNIDLSISLEKLATYLGTIRTSLARELKAMEQDGLIVQEKKRIILLSISFELYDNESYY